MSRTRRTGPVEGFWSTVEDWEAGVVEANRVTAWWSSRCRVEATSGPYLDVTGDLDEGLVLPSPLRRAVVAAEGSPHHDDASLADELREAGVEHRRVTRAVRYRWNGPALTPVVLELHTTEDEAIVEAWWEDVWAAWPTIRLGRDENDRRPARRATATAQINRLFKALALDPLGRPQ